MNTQTHVHPVMRLLKARIPITLLLDLAQPWGPDSRDIIASELPRGIRRDPVAADRVLAV